MCSYNSVNGEPTCTSPLMKAAREAWGFTGYVTSDSDAVGDAYRSHHYVQTGAEASCLAVKDGQCDIDSGNTFYDNLLDGVKQPHALEVRGERVRLLHTVEQAPLVGCCPLAAARWLPAGCPLAAWLHSDALLVAA